MTRKVLSVLLAFMLMSAMLTGCGAVGDIAGSVAEAAGKELENQVKAALEKHKVEVVELKTAVGRLNDEGSDLQFFCAVLVKAESDTVVNGCAEAMDAVFEYAGVIPQTSSKVECPYLIHKEVTFDHRDFSSGGYYTIYIYNSSIAGDLLGAKST